MNVYVVSYLKSLAILKDEDLVDLPCDFKEFNRFKHEDALKFTYEPIRASNKLLDSLAVNEEACIERMSEERKFARLTDFK